MEGTTIEQKKHIEKITKAISHDFQNFKIFLVPEKLQYLIAIYFLLNEKKQNREKVVITTKDVLDLLQKSPSTVYRNVQNFREEPLKGWFEDVLTESGKERGFTLTDFAFKKLERLINKERDFFSLVSTPLTLNRFEEFLLQFDNLYFTVRAVLEINHSISQNSKRSLSLMALSIKLNLRPKELVDLIREYIIIGDIDSSNELKDKYLQIVPRKYKFSWAHLRCDDNQVVCNFLCRKCHRSKVTLTKEGEKMAKYLHKAKIGEETSRYVLSEAFVRKTDNNFSTVGFFYMLFIVFLYFISNQILSDGFWIFFILIPLLLLISWLYSRKSIRYDWSLLKR